MVKGNRMIDEHTTFMHEVKGIISVDSNEKAVIKPTTITVRYSKSENADDTISFSDDKTCMIHVRADDLKKILKEYE